MKNFITLQTDNNVSKIRVPFADKVIRIETILNFDKTVRICFYTADYGSATKGFIMEFNPYTGTKKLRRMSVQKYYMGTTYEHFLKVI